MMSKWRPCSRRILIVEDEVLLAENIGVFLTAAGAEVVIAHSGEEALPAAEALDPQCVIVDYNLPGMNGIETVLRIRERRPEVHSVLITGQGSEAVLAEARAQGIGHVLIKPFALPDLGRCVCANPNAVALSEAPADHIQAQA